MCVKVCVCVCERERLLMFQLISNHFMWVPERKREKKREKEREREGAELPPGDRLLMEN